MGMIETALAEFDESAAMIASVKPYGTLTVAVDGIGKVEEAHKQVKRLRISIDNRRKELNEGALTYQRAVNQRAKELTAEILPIEGALGAQRDEYESEKLKEKQAKDAAKAALLQARVERLAQAGCHAGDLVALSAMSDDDFEWHLRTEASKAEKARAAEAERLAEVARQEEANNAERLRLEKIRQDMAAAAAEDRRKAAEEVERLRLQAEESERQRRADQAALEAEREELRRQQEEIRKAEAAKELAAKQREEEAARAARLEALKPEIEKAEAFCLALETWTHNELERIGNPWWGTAMISRVGIACGQVRQIAERGE